MYKLYGNGINDDAPAIQEMLDSGTAAVQLPPPVKEYCIGSTLKLHSNQSLCFAPTARIRLLPQSSCFMLTNAEPAAENLTVCGGIWDYDNVNQKGNPFQLGMAEGEIRHDNGDPDTVVVYQEFYRGSIMRFCGVEKLTVRDLTLRNPTTYSLEMACTRYFTVENIRFEQTQGNPTLENMDGIHVDGHCRFGLIRNVQGTCYDDMVAINADDGYDGPIEDIEIDGVFGEHSLRGVRLLSIKSPVSRITISNVFGTFYQNCVGLTYYYPRSGRRGSMSHIVLNNIFGENAERKPEYRKSPGYVFSYIWVDSDLDIDHLSVSNLYRTEHLGDIETIRILPETRIDTLSLSNVQFRNKTGKATALFQNDGSIGNLYMYDVDAGPDEVLINRGTISKLVER